LAPRKQLPPIEKPGKIKDGRQLRKNTGKKTLRTGGLTKKANQVRGLSRAAGAKKNRCRPPIHQGKNEKNGGKRKVNVVRRAEPN